MQYLSVITILIIVLLKNTTSLDITIPIPSPTISIATQSIKETSIVTTTPLPNQNIFDNATEILTLIGTILGSIATIATTICLCKKRTKNLKKKIANLSADKANPFNDLPRYNS
jgi:hypothetical protein